MTNRINVAIMMDIIKLANRRRAPVTPALYPVNPIATIAAPISISGAGDQDDDCPIEYRKVEFVEGPGESRRTICARGLMAIIPCHSFWLIAQSSLTPPVGYWPLLLCAIDI